MAFRRKWMENVIIRGVTCQNSMTINRQKVDNDDDDDDDHNNNNNTNNLRPIYICRYVCMFLRPIADQTLGLSGPNLAQGYALTQELF